MNENPQTQWVAVTRSYAVRVKAKSLCKNETNANECIASKETRDVALVKRRLRKVKTAPELMSPCQ